MNLIHDEHYKGYVLGFFFSEDLKYIVLLKKTHPTVQAGKLNGMGGKIKPGESHKAAMRREFKDETDYDYDDWQYLKSFNVENNYCHVFYGAGDLNKCKSMTDEEVWLINVRMLSKPWRWGSMKVSAEDQMLLQDSGEDLATGKDLIDDVADLVEECRRKMYLQLNPDYNGKSVKFAYKPIMETR